VAQGVGPARQESRSFSATLHADDVVVIALQGANQFVFLDAQNT
jgi:hypothetical protein